MFHVAPSHCDLRRGKLISTSTYHIPSVVGHVRSNVAGIDKRYPGYILSPGYGYGLPIALRFQLQVGAVPFSKSSRDIAEVYDLACRYLLTVQEFKTLSHQQVQLPSVESFEATNFDIAYHLPTHHRWNTSMQNERGWCDPLVDGNEPSSCPSRAPHGLEFGQVVKMLKCLAMEFARTLAAGDLQLGSWSFDANRLGRTPSSLPEAARPSQCDAHMLRQREIDKLIIGVIGQDWTKFKVWCQMEPTAPRAPVHEPEHRWSLSALLLR
ncbi:hypothetical protein BDN72DRAFT_906128 [Pluteus cervinus]|uniref:Uncharacterized protein n=1 Tax=Pluteus cervinus TaxID=181527 RepID=A0ACD3A156_9AGAR|nr:hypothetical protein BDN72DRAFT_906128 [Pluteus cervinus]